MEEVGAAEVGAGEVGAGEVGVGEGGAAEVGAEEGGAAEVGAGEVARSGGGKHPTCLRQIGTQDLAVEIDARHALAYDRIACAAGFEAAQQVPGAGSPFLPAIRPGWRPMDQTSPFLDRPLLCPFDEHGAAGANGGEERQLGRRVEALRLAEVAWWLNAVPAHEGHPGPEIAVEQADQRRPPAMHLVDRQSPKLALEEADDLGRDARRVGPTIPAAKAIGFRELGVRGKTVQGRHEAGEPKCGEILAEALVRQLECIGRAFEAKVEGGEEIQGAHLGACLETMELLLEVFLLHNPGDLLERRAASAAMLPDGETDALEQALEIVLGQGPEVGQLPLVAPASLPDVVEHAGVDGVDAARLLQSVGPYGARDRQEMVEQRLIAEVGELVVLADAGRRVVQRLAGELAPVDPPCPALIRAEEAAGTLPVVRPRPRQVAEDVKDLAGAIQLAPQGADDQLPAGDDDPQLVALTVALQQEAVDAGDQGGGGLAAGLVVGLQLVEAVEDQQEAPLAAVEVERVLGEAEQPCLAGDLLLEIEARQPVQRQDEGGQERIAAQHAGRPPFDEARLAGAGAAGDDAQRVGRIELVEPAVERGRQIDEVTGLSHSAVRHVLALDPVAAQGLVELAEREIAGEERLVQLVLQPSAIPGPLPLLPGGQGEGRAAEIRDRGEARLVVAPGLLQRQDEIAGQAVGGRARRRWLDAEMGERALQDRGDGGEDRQRLGLVEEVGGGFDRLEVDAAAAELHQMLDRQGLRRRGPVAEGLDDFVDRPLQPRIDQPPAGFLGRVLGAERLHDLGHAEDGGAPAERGCGEPGDRQEQPAQEGLARLLDRPWAGQCQAWRSRLGHRPGFPPIEIGPP